MLTREAYFIKWFESFLEILKFNKKLKFVEAKLNLSKK